jgi:hypothetical protein
MRVRDQLDEVVLELAEKRRDAVGVVGRREGVGRCR